MKDKLFLIIAFAILLIACGKTENEQGIMDVFFGGSYPGNTGDQGQGETQGGIITVTGLEFANSDGSKLLNGWNNTLYANQMRFLQLRILYNCNRNEQLPVTVFVKILKPDGSLSEASTSPEGYTMNRTFVSAGSKKKSVYQELGGWGNSSGSAFSAGEYKVEVWEHYDEPKKVFEKNLRLR